MNATHLTVRNVPDDLAGALAEERQRRGTSLNQTVIDPLSLSLGVSGNRSKGIKRLAGTWTAAEHEELCSSLSVFEGIDAEFWK